MSRIAEIDASQQRYHDIVLIQEAILSRPKTSNNTMNYTHLPYAVPSGYFPDPMNDNPLHLEAGFPSEEQFLYDGMMTGLDLDVLQLLNSQDNGMGKLPSNEGKIFPTQEMVGVAGADSGKYHHQQPPPLFTDLPTFPTEQGLNDLLQSASPLAAERALFMSTGANPNIDGSNNSAGSPTAAAQGHSQTTLHHSPPPLLAFDDLDPCSSPDTSHFSYPGYDDIYYGVPGEPFPMSDVAVASLSNSQSLGHPLLPSHGNANNNNDNLLEMPDGSTRLTANWLPVDPEVGFTIDVPRYARTSGA
ncbi:hypothetical protein P168DRAFT_317724 [Aspergillus campestris IBT 28561]|uniref:Uncharacterized protein n=1 Tax=Aspergillus campestris (strain IBT 28561) TaxID=1392248 RepID=A0A2I1D479_ASPC2|nr:uncharacterized protein P168DRAFT_317724 [Aspergillus campestris IBT 28561]PKY04675.1 hypothetical protein P168DRAFT_317724 [Aspergillus campestris IBT 28561]